MELNIVELIEKNPLTRLSSHYNVKMLTKIKEQFTDFEQQMFLSSFYCYLNHHPTNDFVIDLDKVWEWMGFKCKYTAKRLLEKCFMINKDYIKSLHPEVKQIKQGSGGQNKEIFMLNVKTFKSMCLKAGTKKADEIHEYYLKMETIIQEVVSEESAEIKKQLTVQKEKLIVQKEKLTVQAIQLQNVEKDKELLKEKTLIEQFPLNTQCIYIGKVDNKTLGIPGHKMYQETVIKFGQTNDLQQRVGCHKKTYDNFILYAAFKVKNKIEIENHIKKHPILKKRVRNITTGDNITHRELLALDDGEFTLEKVEGFIKDIIKQNEYNIENYNLLLAKNDALEIEMQQLKTANTEKDKKITDLSQKLENYTGTNHQDITVFAKSKLNGNDYTLCKYSYFLYVFQYEDMRFICSITRQKDFESIQRNLKHLHPLGEMKYKADTKFPFSEKNMMFLLKQTMTLMGSNKFEGSFENVKLIVDIAVALEHLLTTKATDLEQLLSIVKNIESQQDQQSQNIDPEAPQIKKAKRSIDQINKDTGEIMNTYESIEAAGRSLGLTTGTAIGIALREKRVCQGFLWRYSGVSKEEQYKAQAVFKVCCTTGKKTGFPTIAAAAKDVNISAPALRQRILTHVHLNDHHWIFDKTHF
jgi:hypothetical protein